MTDVTTRSRGWAPLVPAGAGILALLAVLQGCGSDGTDRTGYAPTVTLVGVEPGSPVAVDSATPAIAPAAVTPAEAVRGFLDAEIAGRPEDSYGRLSAADRDVVGEAEDWAATYDERPAYLAYDLVDAGDDQVIVEARRAPMVSEIHGVAPMSERIEFAIAAEDGGFRVALDATTYTARYPEAPGAAVVAADWVRAAQACRPDDAARLEYEGNILGTLGLGKSLCGTEGEPTAAATGMLDRLADPTMVLSAFGDSATEWARIVDIAGLAGPPVQVILAPYGERWVVVGGVAPA